MQIFLTAAPNRFREKLVARISLPMIGPLRIEVPMLVTIKRGR